MNFWLAYIPLPPGHHPRGWWVVSHETQVLKADSAFTGEPQWEKVSLGSAAVEGFLFATFEDALAAARAVVDLVKVNGRTWAQWREIEAERRL